MTIGDEKDGLNVTVSDLFSYCKENKRRAINVVRVWTMCKSKDTRVLQTDYELLQREFCCCRCFNNLTREKCEGDFAAGDVRCKDGCKNIA